MNQKSTIKEHFGEKILDVLFKHVKKGCQQATDDDVENFLYHCAALKLDPLKNQIVLTAFYSKKKQCHEFTAITTINGFRAIGHRHGDCGGVKTKVIYDKQGRIFGARGCVIRSGAKYYSEVLFKEYDASSSSPLWKSKPHTMITKTAEAHAWQRAYPEDLSGIYTEEQFDKSLAEYEQDKIVDVKESVPKQLSKASKPQPGNGIEVHDIPSSEEPNPSIVPDYSDVEIQKLIDRKDVILKRAKEYEIDINQTALDSIENLIECGNFRKLGEKLIAYEDHLNNHVGQAKKTDESIEKLDLKDLYQILRNAELNESYVNTWFGEEIKTYTVAKQAGDHKLANELVASMMERSYEHIAKEKERRP